MDQQREYAENKPDFLAGKPVFSWSKKEDRQKLYVGFGYWNMFFGYEQVVEKCILKVNMAIYTFY